MMAGYNRVPSSNLGMWPALGWVSGLGVQDPSPGTNMQLNLGWSMWTAPPAGTPATQLPTAAGEGEVSFLLCWQLSALIPLSPELLSDLTPCPGLAPACLRIPICLSF